MAPALETATLRASEIYFELDRFEIAAPERIELTGRWFGVRGRRFVRPTLTLTANGARRRLLAAIDHKPWAAEDGEVWVAAFPWSLDGEDVSELELGVAPDIAIELPVPGSAPQRVSAPAARPAEAHPERQGDQTTRLLASAREENERLRDELSAASEASLQAEAALARRDAAISKAEDLAAERDAAAEARNRARDEIGQAVQERDAAVAARDAALGKCEQLVRSVAELQSQLQEARATVQRHESERRQTLLELQHAQVSAAARSALSRNPPSARRYLAWGRSAGSGGSPSWAGRVLAIALLSAAVIALLLIAHVL